MEAIVEVILINLVKGLGILFVGFVVFFIAHEISELARRHNHTTLLAKTFGACFVIALFVAFLEGRVTDA